MINVARCFLNADRSEIDGIIAYYNANCLPLVNRKYEMKNNDDWCAAFVSVVAHILKIRERFPFEVSTIEQVDLSKQAGLFFTDIKLAMEGDLVFFDWDLNGVPNHVGFLVSYQNGVIETIEGNNRGTVGYRQLPDTTDTVLGFVRTPCVMDYSDEHAIEVMAGRVVQGKMGTGQERAEILGRDYELVQARVNEIYQ